MEKTASPLPWMREPRHEAQGPDECCADDPGRPPRTTATILVQAVRLELHVRAQDCTAESSVHRRHHQRGRAHLRPRVWGKETRSALRQRRSPAGRPAVRLGEMLLSFLYRLLCRLLRLLVRCGVDERDVETAVLRHQLRILRRGGARPHSQLPIGRGWQRLADCSPGTEGGASSSARTRSPGGTETSCGGVVAGPGDRVVLRSIPRSRV